MAVEWFCEIHRDLPLLRFGAVSGYSDLIHSRGEIVRWPFLRSVLKLIDSAIHFPTTPLGQLAGGRLVPVDGGSLLPGFAFVRVLWAETAAKQFLTEQGGFRMEEVLIVRGRYVGQTFIPDSQLPHAEGTAQLIITPTSSLASGSIADAFGTASVLRTGDEILAQTRAEREEWGQR